MFWTIAWTPWINSIDLVVYTHHAGDVNVDYRFLHEVVFTPCRPTPCHLDSPCSVLRWPLASSVIRQALNLPLSLTGMRCLRLVVTHLRSSKWSMAPISGFAPMPALLKPLRTLTAGVVSSLVGKWQVLSAFCGS